MIKAEFSFATVAEAQLFFSRLGQTSAVAETTIQHIAPTPVPMAVSIAAPPDPTPAKVRKARNGGSLRGKDMETAPEPKDEPLVPPLDIENGDPLPASMGEPKAITEAEVRDVLRTLSTKHGLDAVREILSSVTGKARISEVDPSQYSAVLAAASERAAA
jgi:hypothetical protein